MTKKAIITERVVTPRGAYSQGIRSGHLVFVAGQGPLNVDGGIVGETIEDQTRKTLSNIRGILETAGAGMTDVVKTTVHLADLGLFQRFNDEYARHFPDPKPVRTTVGSELPEGMLIEMDAIAVA
jgi:2-iminobutanoate/2-iminopropanoate deaminase